MAFVTVKAPTGVIGARYGNIEIRMRPDGTADVPSFVAKHLTAMGFTSDIDLSKLDPSKDLNHVQAVRIIEAYGTPSELEDIRNAAVLKRAQEYLKAPPPISLGHSRQ